MCRLYVFIVLLCCYGHHAALAQTSYDHLFTEAGVIGSTVIYDYQSKRWMYTDSTDADCATLPASTFKVFHSLLALETKTIKSVRQQLKWDGLRRGFNGADLPAWNKDTDMQEAFKNSTVWFYVRLAEKIKRTVYQRYLTAAAYGNGDLSEAGTDFWNYGPFAVTPKEQILLLVDLYENKLPFAIRNQNAVKDIMLSTAEDGYVYRDKTGWTSQHGQDIGWWIGYVDVQGKIYFYATRIRKAVDQANPNFAAARKEITKAILHDYIWNILEIRQ